MSARYLIRGSLIAFRAVTEHDVENTDWYDWWNDETITRHFWRGALPNTKEGQRDFFRSLQGAHDQVVFAVDDLKSDTFIGIASIRSIDWVNRNANVALVIGYPAYWKGGIALEIFQLLATYGFTKLNLHKLKGAFVATHEASLKCAERVGFEVVGTAREEVFKDGAYRDYHYAEVLRNRWKQLQ
jgi:ribosomal-protein-alanine N-acetyltransferase